MKPLLAVDPGREKCGLAVVTSEGILHREIVPRTDVAGVIESLASRYQTGRIIVGDGTGGSVLAKEIRDLAGDIPIELVDESHSSRRARARFLDENPKRGLRRLIPRGLLTPDRPYDDYVAVILAEDYLRNS